MSRWAVIGVESNVAWPTTNTDVEFRGHTLVLRPATDEHVASVAFNHPPEMSLDDALGVIRQFLSNLCWVEQAGIREVGASGGSGPFFVGRGLRGQVITNKFQHDYLPDPQDERTRLALAFYREGMSSETIPYRFLNFFKILNILFAGGKQQVDWINAHLGNISDFRAKQRLAELTPTAPDIGEYLYGSGRCAVAHAFSDPLINPEDPEDNRRLAKDLPIIQALAEIVIEREFGVKTRHTVWREHLYQLEGFRNLLGEPLTQALKAGTQLSVSDIPAFPRLTLKVRGAAQLDSLAGLIPMVVAVEEGVIWLRCDAPDGALQTLIGLDVRDEHLLFDPEEHLAVLPDQSAPALRARRDHLQLMRGLLTNGQLEVVATDTGERLGRTDAYIPQNIDVRRTLANFDRIHTEIEAALTQIGDA